MSRKRQTPKFEVDVLGPVRARHRGSPVAVPGPKQQALLATLALAGSATVSVAALIEALWEDPPRNPEHALRAHVSRLRALIPIGIEWLHGGYRLAQAVCAVDAVAFGALARRARRQAAAGHHAGAVATFDHALRLWRGAAFAGLPETRGLRHERARLDGLREAAVSDRLDCLLAAGEADLVAAEARAAVTVHPLREHSWVQLMTALHSLGRRAEALAAYQELRGALRDALGSEPSAAVSQAHIAILRAESAPPAPCSARESSAGARRRNQRVRSGVRMCLRPA